MTVIEIILLIVGMLFILVSFWVTEKLSPGEVEHISELSKEEMGVILERELQTSRERVEELVDATIDASKERTERALEKQTNEKIMAINEFSDTVIEKMNKTHNEIMFLYSMLNDKHTELTNFSSGLTQQMNQMKEQSEQAADYLNQIKQQNMVKAEEAPAAVIQAPEPDVEKNASETVRETEEPPEDPEAETPAEEADEQNVREKIFALYQEGKDSVSIARKLGMGGRTPYVAEDGEVRLILGLYKGEYSSEV